MKKIVYHIGDKVKIINPLFIQRVGYVWDKKYVIKNVITPEQKQALEEFLIKCGFVSGTSGGGLFSYAYEEIMERLAYWVLRKEGFGGKERSIHTKLRETAREKIATIIKKRVVKTGKYTEGRTTGWEEPEYNPPYLSNEKSHVLLTLDYYFDDNLGMEDDIWPPEIEECNVALYERVKKWKACLYPNNQPTIELGIFTATNKPNALRQVCYKYNLKEDDTNLYLEALK